MGGNLDFLQGCVRKERFIYINLKHNIVTEVSPTRPSPVRIVRPEPALSGHTTPRRRGRPPGRLGPPPSRTEQATQHFLQADEYWRKFKQQQHRDNMEIRREQNRIRELEVQANMSWQTVAMRVTDLLDKLVDKYCKD